MGILRRFFGPPSKHKFARLVQGGIRKAGETRALVYDREEFCLSTEGENQQIAFLGNAYQEYCAVPVGQRPQVLGRCVRGWFVSLREMPDQFEDLGPDLLPAVRARAYFELNALRGRIDGHEMANWPYQVLGEHFAVGLVYDMPESVRIITQDDLDGWGVSFYQALEAARENLAGLQAAFAGPKEGTGVYLSATQDNNDAARLLMLELVKRFSLQGDPIAMVPNRDCLIVAGSDDPESLIAMLKLAEEGLKQPRPLLGVALRLQDDAWEPWLPEADHPLYREFKLLQVQSLGQDYHEQKTLLDELHEKTGEDVFVANYSAFEQQDGAVIQSYAVWAEGATDGLLPKVDLIGFVPESGEPGMVKWKRAVERVGDMMELLDMYPIRYRVREFPTSSQFAEMACK